MTTSTSIVATFETAKTTDHTGAGATFVAIGTPLLHPASILIISSSYVNATPVPISAWLSTDDTNNKLLVPGQEVTTIEASSAGLAFPTGTQFYLKQGPDGAPTAGDFSITAIYGS